MEDNAKKVKKMEEQDLIQLNTEYYFRFSNTIAILQIILLDVNPKEFQTNCKWWFFLLERQNLRFFQLLRVSQNLKDLYLKQFYLSWLLRTFKDEISFTLSSDDSLVRSI